jgi:hypothetical protein
MRPSVVEIPPLTSAPTGTKPVRGSARGETGVEGDAEMAALDDLATAGARQREREQRAASAATVGSIGLSRSACRAEASLPDRDCSGRRSER